MQATLGLPEGFWDGLEDDDPAGALRELVDDEREVVIARRVPAEGRARALVDGQAAPREAVASLARAALRFSGQGEHRRLVSPAAQLGALDAFAGSEATAGAARLAGAAAAPAGARSRHRRRPVPARGGRAPARRARGSSWPTSTRWRRIRARRPTWRPSARG